MKSSGSKEGILSRLTIGKLAAVLSFAILLPAVAWAQQVDTTDNDSPVIPPPPQIQKKSPNSIAIPVADASPRYQQQAAAATNVKIAGETATNAKPANSTSAGSISGTISTNAKVGSTFGYRRDPFTRREKFHSGCDIKAHWGQPVGASLPGTVQFAGWYHGYGNMIIIEHGGGVATHYAHLSSFAVEPGEHVDRGSIIGYAGSTGRATSPHLHYEVRIDGSAVNPLDQIALDGTSEFFKNVAAARLTQPAQPAQQVQPGAVDSKHAVEPSQPSPAKAAIGNQTRPDAVKPAGDNKTARPTQSGGNDASVSQERPRRVTQQ